MKQLILLICLSMLLILFFSCSSEEWDGEIVFEDGVKVITNFGKSMWSDEKKAIFNEELSLGSFGEDENQIFHQPMDVKPDKWGNIYVLDSGNNRIQKFDEEGNYLLSIGKKGQGPGEIANSADIEIDSHGNILVFDVGNNRISKFNSQGVFLNSFLLKFPAFDGALDSEDNIYIYRRYKGKLIHKFNSNGKYLISFFDEIKSKIKRIEPHINGSGDIYITKDDKIILGLTLPYTIYILNTEGELLEEIRIMVPYAKAPFVTGQDEIPPNAVMTPFYISGLSISPKGEIFCNNMSIRMPDKFESMEFFQEIMNSFYTDYSFLDLIDTKGRFLTHQQVPNICEGGSFDSDGYYYIIEEAEDYFRVIKFSIRYN